MTFSWLPVIWVDVLGSSVTLLLAVLCALRSWRWTNRRREDSFRYYIFLLTLSFTFFAVSRSFGHIVKQGLLFYEMSHIWKQISPFSGSINTATFITVFAFGIYFHRSRKVYMELELHKNHLEEIVGERTSELEEKNIQLQAAFAEVKKLSGFLPICASCKKIRDDKGYWNQIEEYIRDHSEAEFSHSVCPDCAQKLYPDFNPYKEEE